MQVHRLAGALAVVLGRGVVAFLGVDELARESVSELGVVAASRPRLSEPKQTVLKKMVSDKKFFWKS